MHHKRTRIIMFNYGGGMRGLVPAHCMTYIEEMTGLQMAEMVDVFCGPSTGSILNAALNVPRDGQPSKPKFRARHMVRFYEREGDKIFPPDRFRDFRGFIHDFNNRTMKIGQLNSLLRHGHYETTHLKRSLRALYGEMKMSQTVSNLVIPVYNIDGQSLHALAEKGDTDDAPVHNRNSVTPQGGHAVWLKNVQLSKNNRPPPVYLYDAVTASCAAPTYFPSHHFQMKNHKGVSQNLTGIDGSIFDNPCTSYHGALSQHLTEDDHVIMITLGTGYTHHSITKDKWDSYGGLGVVDPVNDLPLISILFHAAESALVESFTEEMGDNLYMFNKPLKRRNFGDYSGPNAEIDDASPENLKALEKFAMEMIEDNKMRFHEVCHHLVRNRDRSHAERENWLKKLARATYFMR